MNVRWDGGFCVACGHGWQAHHSVARGLPIPCCGAVVHHMCGCEAAFAEVTR